MQLIRQKSLVDLGGVLGASAAAILEAGRKLEIESIVPPMLADQKARRTLIKWLRPQ